MKSIIKTRSKWDQAYRKKYPERIKTSSRAWYNRNKEKEKTRGQKKYIKLKQEHPEKIKQYYETFKLTPKSKFKGYKNNARIRKLIFDLTLEQFIGFWQKSCHYCGSSIDTIGIDRVDNKNGYTIENVVACCRKCNHMKRDWEVSQFIDHCRKVAKSNP